MRAEGAGAHRWPRAGAGQHTLGFRHGPKSTLDGNTLVVVLRSVQPLARRYEQDLLEELRRDGVAGQVLAIGPHSDIGADDEYTLTVPALDDPWLAPVWLGFAQLFAHSARPRWA